MAKYSATSETLASGLESFVPFELCPELRETFTASASVAAGDIVSKAITVGSDTVTLYGVAAASAASGAEFPAVVRGFVLNSAAYDSIADAAKKALLAQGVKIL